MVELHSNFTADGQHNVVNGMYPTNHAEHETIEITQGINKWSEVGFYIFTSERSGQGIQWVGDHIRPRVRVPDSWHWPVGVSLSTEFGYQRARYAPDTWDWEIRPIVDKQSGRWYWSVNPALERAWHGPDVDSRRRLCSQCKSELRLYEEDHRRHRVLRRLRKHHPHRQPSRSATAVLPRHRPQRLARLGTQLRRRHRPHRRHRPLDREMHRRPSLQLGTKTQIALPVASAGATSFFF